MLSAGQRHQLDNAIRLAYRGAGVTVSKNASPAMVAAAVQRELTDRSFGIAAIQLGEKSAWHQMNVEIQAPHHLRAPME